MGTGRKKAGGAAALAAAAALSAAAADTALEIWRDPTFQKQFLGSYGAQAEIEPRVTAVEKEQMEKILAMMSADGGFDKARQYLERSIKPGMSATFPFTLANIYFQQDKLAKAAEWYHKAIEEFPSFQRAYKNLGLVHARAGEYDKALAPLTRAVELGSTEGLTYGLLAYAYSMTERYASAEGAYRQAMMLQPETVDWKLGLARCLFKQRKFEEAASLCDELILREPERADYWLLQANAYLGMKQPMKAAENYEYLDLSGSSTPQSLNTLGDIYVNEGLMDLAGGAYLRAMARDAEGDPGRYLRDGEVLAARGAYGEAEAVLARVRELYGPRLGTEERKRLLKLEARLAAARGAADDEQARLLDQIVALDPLDGEALILLAQHHASAGNLEKAGFLFERASGLEQYEADARLRHGQCLVRNGRYQDAIPLLKRAQEIRPREDVARYLEQVERVARSKS